MSVSSSRNMSHRLSSFKFSVPRLISFIGARRHFHPVRKLSHLHPVRRRSAGRATPRRHHVGSAPSLRISRCIRLRLTAYSCACREQFVDPPQQSEIVVAGRRRWPIDAGSRNAEQLALAADRQPAVLAVDELSAARGEQ